MRNSWRRQLVDTYIAGLGLTSISIVGPPEAMPVRLAIGRRPIMHLARLRSDRELVAFQQFWFAEEQAARSVVAAVRQVVGERGLALKHRWLSLTADEAIELVSSAAVVLRFGYLTSNRLHQHSDQAVEVVMRQLERARRDGAFKTWRKVHKSTTNHAGNGVVSYGRFLQQRRLKVVRDLAANMRSMLQKNLEKGSGSIRPT